MQGDTPQTTKFREMQRIPCISLQWRSEILAASPLPPTPGLTKGTVTAHVGLSALVQLVAGSGVPILPFWSCIQLYSLRFAGLGLCQAMGICILSVAQHQCDSPLVNNTTCVLLPQAHEKRDFRGRKRLWDPFLRRRLGRKCNHMLKLQGYTWCRDTEDVPGLELEVQVSEVHTVTFIIVWGVEHTKPSPITSAMGC